MRDNQAYIQPITTTAIVLVGGYIALQMMSDIAATKAIVLGPLTMDGGIIYSLTFTWRDLIHKRLGVQAARASILLAAVVNIVMALYFWMVVELPATDSYIAEGGQDAWAFVFGLDGMLARIVFASVVAEVIAELADTEIYQMWVTRRTRHLPQWMRVLASNAVSIPLDSALFVLIAFSGVLAAGELRDMFASNVVTKGVFSLVSLWMIYLVRDDAPSRVPVTGE
jgi:uncharacterized integral membrane protein (TIGR00697 family)